MKTKDDRPRARRAWLPAACAALALLLVPSWALIGAGFVKGRGAFDQLNYHEQVVRTFAEQLPTPDFHDYLSATTPGYHTVLAVVARVISDERQVLQWFGSLFTVALVVLLAWGVRGPPNAASRRASHPLVLVLPLAVSMAVFYSATWLLPDNAGWLGVLAVWLLALRPRFDAVTVVGGGLALGALILVRQIHLWPLAMLLTAAWIGSARDDEGPFDFAADARALLANIPASLGRVLLIAVAAVPAVAALLYFWLLWDRTLTPPVFDDRHVGGNLAAPAFVLAVFGPFSLCFLPFVLDGLRLLWVRHTWLLIIAIAAGLLIALTPETTRSYFEGRYSGLWEIVRHLPAPLGRSVLIVPLALLGSVMLAAWFVVLGRRDRWIMLAAMVAFTAAQCASFKLWQRYTEPMVLLWLALAAARVAPARSGAGEGWRIVGPVALALAMAAITAASLFTARPVQPRALLAPWEMTVPVLPGMVEPYADRMPPTGGDPADPPDDQPPADR